MNKQSAHGLKGLRTFQKPAANVISSVPVCAAGEEGECNLCAMGHYCPNASADKPRIRVCLSWTADQVDCAMRIALNLSTKPRARIDSGWHVTRIAYACIVAVCDAAAVVAHIALQKVCFSDQFCEKNWSDWKSANAKRNAIIKMRMKSFEMVQSWA